MAQTSTKSSEPNMRARSRDKRHDDLREQDKGQGVVRDDRGQEQPADKRRAQQNAGLRAQKEAAESEDDVPSPGEPARGE